MISICLPTYNRLPLLKQCLEAIFNGFENYPYEVVIADGGSTDGTLEYLYDLKKENLKIIEQKKLLGMVKAFNACFKKAEGDHLFISNDDAIVIPKIMIEACKLLDNDEQIGLVAPKDRETTRANIHGITHSRIRKYWVLISKFHIIRASVFKKINYFDESFRSYYIDDDSFLSVMKLGYTSIFTREVGNIHYRIPDISSNKARMLNTDKNTTKNERDYLFKKWSNLETSLREYLRYTPLKRRKAVTFTFVCEKMYTSNNLRPFIERNQKVSLKFYDWCLDKALVFKDKKYSNLKDFFLPQKYPDDLLASVK